LFFIDVCFIEDLLIVVVVLDDVDYVVVVLLLFDVGLSVIA
jgi:hypothetical protein